MQILRSKLDESVNVVHSAGFESRYVHRPDADYFIIYLSSHTGCNKACRFCHLTQTGQTSMQEADLLDFRDQATPLFAYNAKFLKKYEPKLRKLHYNFMARGEPLANRNIIYEWEKIQEDLFWTAKLHGIDEVKFKISTIMPEETKRLNLPFTFGSSPEIYYSLYSLRSEFRKRWLPKARNPYSALAQLADWQQDTGGKIVIHFPIINDQNDFFPDHENMIRTIKEMEIETRFNLVAYNPPDEKSWESNHAWHIFQMWKDAFPDSKMVERVGYDVKASCGMFV